MGGLGMWSRRTRRSITLRAASTTRRRRRIVVLLALGGVLATGAWLALQQLNVSTTWKVATASASAVIPLLLAEVRARVERREQQDRHLINHFRFFTPAGGRRVREVEDPDELGVTPAAATESSASRPSPVQTPYIRRTIDEGLDDALRTSSFVLLVGGSKAGKSRTAYEAMQRVFPERLLLVPNEQASLRIVNDLGLELPDSVMWLGDLEQYLGPNGLTVGMLDRLTNAGAGRVIVLGTMRTTEYVKFQPDQDIVLPERKLLERARRIHLERKLDAAEKKRAAEQANDPRVEKAVANLDRYGLAEYLAAGPALLDRLTSGTIVAPLGAAIVRAAVDWHRSGLARPIPRDLLRKLYPVFLDDHTGQHLSDETFESALAWGARRIFATASLLIEQADGLLAFDYMVDYFEESGDQHPIAPDVWDLAFRVANGPSETFAVAMSAYSKDQYLRAEQGFRQAVGAVGSDSEMFLRSAFNLGVLLRKRGELDEAETWWRPPASAGVASAMSNLGTLLEERGELEEAEIWLRRAAETGLPRAANNLAGLLYDRGAVKEAETWWWRAASSGHAEAAYNLGLRFEQREQIEEAEACYRQAAPRYRAAATNLGRILAQRGDVEEAEDWFRRAADAGDAKAAFNLAVILSDRGAVEEAETWYRNAANGGVPAAANNLGSLLDARGEVEEAERWLRRAAEGGIPTGALNLARWLYERGEVDEAIGWFWRAMEAEDDDLTLDQAAQENVIFIDDEDDAGSNN